MKNLIACLIILTTVLCLYGCKYFNKNAVDDENESANSDEALIEDPDVSGVDYSKITEEYRFLVSPYSITATKTSFDTVYKCDYYFINGKVSGTKSTITFENEDAAEEYHKTVLDDDEFAYISGVSVVHFAHSEDCFYDGFTPEKLYYVLQDMGYEVVFNFNLKEFNDKFNNVSKA